MQHTLLLWFLIVVLCSGCSWFRSDKNATQTYALDGASPITQEIPTPTAKTQEPISQCSAANIPAYRYKKRVGIFTMPLERRQDAIDFPLIETEYPQELLFRLNQNQHLIGISATHHYQPEIPPTSASHSIREIAEKLKVQFLVTGQILDMSYYQDDAEFMDFVARKKKTKPFKQSLFQKMSGNHVRQLQMEIRIYDGPSEELLHTQRFSHYAYHKIHPGAKIDLQQAQFWVTDYGKIMNKMLFEQVEIIEKTLECKPLRAYITNIQQDQLEINAGEEANLNIGDRLKVFHNEYIGRDNLGNPKFKWQYAGELNLTAVSLSASLGTYQTDAEKRLQVGDLVQAW
jgi:hypothetical protein